MNAAAFHPTEPFLAYAIGGFVHMWSVQDQVESYSIAEMGGNINNVIFSPDGFLLAYTSGHGDEGSIPTTTVVDLSNNQKLYTYQGHEWSITNIAFSRDSKFLVSSSLDQTIRFWDLLTGSEISALRLDNKPFIANSISLNTDDTVLAAGGDDGILRLWNVQTGELVAELTGHEDKINSITFNLAGNIIASSSSDGTTRIWGIVQED